MLVGIDSVEIVRMEKFIQNERFLNKYFTSNEAAYVNETVNKTQRLAGLFAVKEAFLKALGVGIYNGIEFSEIEVMHYDGGKPYVRVSDNAKRIMYKHGVENCEISVTHTKNESTAFVILY